jgi:hypothetical protein
MSGSGSGKPPKKPPGWDTKTQTFQKEAHSSGRVDFNVAQFEKVIKEKGTRVKVFRTVFCPNVKSIDGAEHNIDCKQCNGSGFLDVHPIDTISLIQNQSLEKMPFVEGMVDGNSVAATFSTGIELQYFTKVELMDFTEPFFQRILRQEGNVDVLKYRAHHVNVLIGQNGKEYYGDIDFSLDANGSIAWKPNRGPNPGDIYSIHYESAVQFRAVRAMHTNRFSQYFDKTLGGAVHTKLPEQWLLQKEFMVKRTDSLGNEILPNTIVPKTDPDAPEED